MPDFDDGDYQNILTQLYSRKLTRKAFTMIRDDFKAKTGKDLCNIVAEAQDEIIKDIVDTPAGRKGADVRTRMFKLTDYSSWMRYCPRKEK